MKNGKIHLGPIVDSYNHVVGVKLAMQTMNRDGDCGEEIAYFDNLNIAKACIKPCAKKVRIIRWEH